jgi:N utilization substance protein A
LKINTSEITALANSLEVSLETIVRPVREALTLAYLKSTGLISENPRNPDDVYAILVGNHIRVELDLEKGQVNVFKAGEIIGEADVTPADFDRIAAESTRRVLAERIRIITDDAQITEIEDLVGTMVSGIVQQGPDHRMVYVSIGKFEAQMPPAEQVPNEKYRHGDRIKVILVAIRKMNNRNIITVSRTHPGLVRSLFALEVPEVADGTVEIMALVREAGDRAKMAVISNSPQVAAKGSCIGPLGQRVNNVVSELNGEKIDIVDFSEDPAKFIAAALAPARVLRVDIVDEVNQQARVFVPDFQLSLAIGKQGQNARLAARLTTWKIDIRSDADEMFQNAGSATY